MSGLLGRKLGSYEVDNIFGGQPYDLMRMKQKESMMPAGSDVAGAGVYDSIKERGFQGHVQINASPDRPELWEGHHRLAAATTAEQSGLGNQFVGLDYVDPLGRYGPQEHSKPSYEERFPQNPRPASDG